METSESCYTLPACIITWVNIKFHNTKISFSMSYPVAVLFGARVCISLTSSLFCQLKRHFFLCSLFGFFNRLQNTGSLIYPNLSKHVNWEGKGTWNPELKVKKKKEVINRISPSYLNWLTFSLRWSSSRILCSSCCGPDSILRQGTNPAKEVFTLSAGPKPR